MDELLSTVDWSRGQFALTAIVHWLFVPLSIGLSLIVGIMETLWLRTRNERWKRMAKFWMLLFGINFACGVATGLILEFEFGTNWSNYSWFVGDIFGAPLAIEGIVAFFSGIDLYRRDVFRVEQGQPRVPSCRHMAHGYRYMPVGLLDIGCQRMDAVSCRDGVRSGPDA